MTHAELSHAQSCDRIRANPKFQHLVRSRARLAWSLMLVVAFHPALVHAPRAEGRQLTVGIPVAAGVIVLSWLCTGWRAR